MEIKPLVRYMLLCDDWFVDPDHRSRVHIVGLISNIRSLEEPPYPFLFREFCVYLALTEGRGQGTGRIVCVFEDSGQPIFQTRPRLISFGSDPLAVIGVPYRISDCRFPEAGLYTVQFWFDDEKLAECPLRLR